MSDYVGDCLKHTKIESNPWWLIPVAIGLAALVTGLLFWWITEELPTWAWVLMIIGVVFIIIGAITFILTKSRIARCYLGLNKQEIKEITKKYIPENVSIPMISLSNESNPISVMMSPVGIPNIPTSNIINTSPIIPSKMDTEFSDIIFNE